MPAPVRPSPAPRHGSAVLGRPIAHSLSPVLHRAAYAALGLDWTYQARDVGEVELPGVLAELAGALAGVSLTMPLKLAAAKLVGRLVAPAEQLGAVNTVLFAGPAPPDWVGHNTDVAGVAAALDELGVAANDVALLGAGGSARAVLGALADRGGRLTCLVRDPARASGLAALGARLGRPVAVQPLAAFPAGRWPLVISTLPAQGNAAVAGACRIWPHGALLDLGYEPWPTPLARLAGRSGAPVVGGLAVLVAQAGQAVALLTGMPAPIAAMRAAGEAVLAERLRLAGQAAES